MRVYQIIVEADIPRKRRSTFPMAALSVPATNLALVPQPVLSCYVNPAITAGAILPEFPLETRLHLDTPQPAGGATLSVSPHNSIAAEIASLAAGSFATTPPPLQSITQQLASLPAAGSNLTPNPLPVHVAGTGSQVTAGYQVSAAPLASQLALLKSTTVAGLQASLTPLATLTANLSQPILAGCQIASIPLTTQIAFLAPTVGSQVSLVMACLPVQVNQLGTAQIGGTQLPLTSISQPTSLVRVACTGGFSGSLPNLSTQLTICGPTPAAGMSLALTSQRIIVNPLMGAVDLFLPVFLNLTPLHVDSTISLTGQLQPPSPLVCYSIVLQPEFGCEVIIQPQINLEVEFQEC